MNGIVGSYIHFDKKGGALVEILCETDFAANTQIVSQFANWLAMILYGYQIDSWTELLNSEGDKVGKIATIRLEQIKAELKEEVKVGRCSMLKLGIQNCTSKPADENVSGVV